MRTFKKIANWIRDSKGVATSLIEATATVAVGAVLAGVAVGGAIDAINNSKVQAAIADVSAIGTGMITFYKDNSFFPLFVDGQKTGGGEIVELLINTGLNVPVRTRRNHDHSQVRQCSCTTYQRSQVTGMQVPNVYDVFVTPWIGLRK